MEKLFPISINPHLCVRCQKCAYSCPSKAIFFRDSLRFVDFNKCRGCLKCVDVCEYNAIEVISLEEGELTDFRIDLEVCNLCKDCLESKYKKALEEIQEEIKDFKLLGFIKDIVEEALKE